jgi:2-oxo-hept-3-ene-1,7-dioate hydratase
MRGRFILVASLLGLAGASSAACPGPEAVAAYLAEFKAGVISKGFGKDLNLADAGCARARLVAALPQVLGRPVGYKAVFTNADSQRRFGVDGPAWGAMFDGMMLPSGARLPARFGAKPRYESDFIVVLKDAGLAEAQTPLEALEHISELIPFIELPDLMLDGKISGAELIAVNAAFRGGVLGPRIPVQPGQALLDALAEMEVVITERRSGKEVGRERGRVLMGQPINAALWLARALKQDGVSLRPGDLLSLGGFLASAPTEPGTEIAIRYQGLPGDPEVRVSFD